MLVTTAAHSSGVCSTCLIPIGRAFDQRTASCPSSSAIWSIRARRSATGANSSGSQPVSYLVVAGSLIALIFVCRTLAKTAPKWSLPPGSRQRLGIDWSRVLPRPCDHGTPSPGSVTPGSPSRLELFHRYPSARCGFAADTNVGGAPRAELWTPRCADSVDQVIDRGVLRVGRTLTRSFSIAAPPLVVAFTTRKGKQFDRPEGLATPGWGRLGSRSISALTGLRRRGLPVAPICADGFLKKCHDAKSSNRTSPHTTDLVASPAPRPCASCSC